MKINTTDAKCYREQQGKSYSLFKTRPEGIIIIIIFFFYETMTTMAFRDTLYTFVKIWKIKNFEFISKKLFRDLIEFVMYLPTV